MQVRDLNESQREAMNEMALELMAMGVMWAIDTGNQRKMMERGQRPDASTISAFDIIREVMGDFPKETADIKPSTFDDFLITLDQA